MCLLKSDLSKEVWQPTLGHLASSISVCEFIQTNKPDTPKKTKYFVQQNSKVRENTVILKTMPTAYLNTLVLLGHIHHSEIKVHSLS